MGRKEEKVNIDIPKQNIESEKERDSTIFDSVFKTLLQKFPKLAVALINEAFHTGYSENEAILQGRNEYHKEKGRIINDSIIKIREKLYHFEVQSTKDGLMAIRMIEYDFYIALEETRCVVTEELHKTSNKNNQLPIQIRFPQSCVIYLRPGLELQDFLKMEIVMPNGQIVFYDVNVMQAQDFSCEEIFRKKLFILLPFYILRYEKDIHMGNCEILDKLEEEYRSIREQLIKEGNKIKEPKLYYDLAILTQKILNYVGKDNKEFKERMCNAMGGAILELESDKIWDEAWGKAWDEAWYEATEENNLKSIKNLMETQKFTAQQAMDALKIPVSLQMIYEEKLER